MSLSLSSASAYRGSIGPIANGFEFSERVLVVDDSRLVRSVFAAALGRKYECLCVESCEWALAYLDVYDVDVVILDSQLSSSADVLATVLRDHPETDVIMMSAGEGPKRVVDVKRGRSVEYLQKPCDIRELESAVGRATKPSYQVA